MIVAFDTMFVIWGILRESRPIQAEKIPLAQEVLGELEKNKEKLGIPSVVLAEALAGIPLDRLEEYRNKILNKARIYDFNAQAAFHTAKIRTNIDLKADPYSRICTKADLQIVGTLLAHGIKVLYTVDNKLIRLCDSVGISIRKESQQESLDLK